MNKIWLKLAEILLPIVAQIIATQAKKWLEKDEKTIEKEEQKIEAVNQAAKKAEDAIKDINRKIAEAKTEKLLNPGARFRTASHDHHDER